MLAALSLRSGSFMQILTALLENPILATIAVALVVSLVITIIKKLLKVAVSIAIIIIALAIVLHYLGEDSLPPAGKDVLDKIEKQFE
jgi:hypothetical protein